MKHERNLDPSILIEGEDSQSFRKKLSSIEEFLLNQKMAGLLLVISTLAALILANNSATSDFYFHLLHVPVGFVLAGHEYSMSLAHFTNDFLMAIFFTLIGLEIKRERIKGELKDIKKAMLPIWGALGGIIVPSLIAYYFNYGLQTEKSWAIPAATDIAFAIAALSLFKGKIPLALITFLTALAIIDDLGAIIIIALFYTDTLNTLALWFSVGFIMIMFVLNRLSVQSIIPYVVMGMGLWLGLLMSGIHATLAGVITAFMIPAVPYVNPRKFSEHISQLAEKFRISDQSISRDSLELSEEQQALAAQIQAGAKQVQPPMARFEHKLHLPVSFFIIPFFAFINAGIPLSLNGLSEQLLTPLALGISLGLILGKLVGIFSFSYIATKLGIANLPAGVNKLHLMGVSALGGIGFTMSIFISELAFKGSLEYLMTAKLAVFVGSLVSLLLGVVILQIASAKK